jgi:DNA repair ATPase RecN
MQNLNDIINQPELIKELPAQIKNTMQYVQVLAEYLEITESKLSSYQPRIAAVTTIIRDLRNTSLQAMQIADSLEEAFEGNLSYKENLKQLSILMPRIHEQVNKIHKSIETDENYANLTASIGITYESYELPDSTRNKACAFNSVSIYEDNIQEIKNPTEQEMISILKSIMGDKSNLDYIESIVTRKCR